MSVSLLQSAFVFGAVVVSVFAAGGVASFTAGGAVVAGASAANTGALTANRNPATITVLIILADM